MKNQMILAAAAVPSLRVADADYNTGEIVRIASEHRDCGLIVFPELCVTGYTCADLFGSELLLEKAEQALLRIAEETKACTGMTIVVGAPLRYEGNLYNCAVCISEGKICAVTPKQWIPDYSEFYEGRWFASGKKLRGRTIRIGGMEIPFGTDLLAADPESGAVLGTEICEDLWVPDKPGTHLCLAGANLIANLSASDELIGKQEYRRRLVMQQSADCYCAYIYCSAGTDESSTDLVFSGHAMIAQSGTLLTEQIFSDRPQVSVAAIDLTRIAHDRTHQNTFGTEETGGCRTVEVKMQTAGSNTVSIAEMAEILKRIGYPVSRMPFVPADDAERMQRCEKILQIQANGLVTRVRATGMKNLVIGISGGLDSTLALLVCAKAREIIPGIRIIAYTLPNQGNTSGRTYSNARELMRLLADECYEVPIADGVQQHLAAIGHSAEYQGEEDVAYENAQARMRTYILMDVANMRGGMVIGTGDLSELALGWCTYNGDHMSMYAVNVSVPKTLVRYLCAAYAENCGNEKLKDTLRSIIDTPISPELTPAENGRIAQKTEDKVGKYDLNDFFLFYTLRYGFEPSRTAAYAMRAYPELSKEEIVAAAGRFIKRFFTQQFKRSCLPDGPKVGSVSLSPRGDWRMPSDASYDMWLADLEGEN